MLHPPAEIQHYKYTEERGYFFCFTLHLNTSYVANAGFGNGSIRVATTCGRRSMRLVCVKEKNSALDELTVMVSGAVSDSSLQLLTTPIRSRIFNRVSS